MAGTYQILAGLTLAALLTGAPAAVRAQTPGELNGKLTDLRSVPLAGATVIARNQATGAEARTTTAANGAYRFAALPPGQYTLEAVTAGQGWGRLEGIAVSAGYTLRLQTAMNLEALPAPASAARRAPTPLAPLPALETATLTETLTLAETAPMELPRRVILPQMELQTIAAAYDLRLPSSPLALELPLPAREFSPEATRPPAEPSPTEPVVAGSTTPNPAQLMPAKLGAAGTSTPPAMRMVNQLWGGGTAFAAGVAAIAALRPAIAALPLQSAEPVAADPADSLTTVDAQQLQSLPAAGRRWQDFLPQSPPPPAPANREGEEVVHGSYGQQLASVDGLSPQLAFGTTAAGSAEPLHISEAAIATVRLDESGGDRAGLDSMGAEMTVETRQGSEKFHGQVFLFSRQNLWGAQNPFSFWVKETASATSTTVPTFTAQPYSPPDQEMALGFGLGGRLRARRLFWFAALDSNYRYDPGVATVRHPENFFAQPTNDQMQVLSARLGLSATNPVVAGLAKYSQELESLSALLGPSTRHSLALSGFARLDWQAGERHRFSAEFLSENRSAPGGGMNRVVEPYGNHSFGDSRSSSQWLLWRWQSYLTPNLLTASHASLGRTLETSQPGKPSAYESQFLASAWNQLPQIVVDSRYGFTFGNPASFGPGSHPDERRLELRELLDWARPGLLIKAGFQLNHNQDVQGFLRNQTGSYHYANLTNFVSDAAAFRTFGIAGQLDPANQHNCDQTGRVWRDTTGQLRGLGYLPCYSYYTQTMGPTGWWLNTNDWSGFVQVQAQPAKTLTLSGGLRWQRELMPPAIARLRNPDLPLTAAIPSPGNEWAPRFSLAWGGRERHWPVLRLGYGMYFGRTQNATLMTALTHTGSALGDLDFFMRPTDNLNSGGAPPFPYVLVGEPLKMIKPGAVEFASNFRNGQVHQALVGLEEALPGRFRLTATTLLSLGRRLPVTADTNFDSSVNPGAITYQVVDPAGLGPIKKSTLTVPFYASWPSVTGTKGRANPNYQQIIQIQSRANSVYEAAILKLDRASQRGITLHVRYTYAHAMDWNPNESTQVTGTDLLDPAHFEQEYGTSDLDIRHTVTGTLVWPTPWKFSSPAARLANGWRLSAIGQFHSGMPFTMRTSSGLVKEFVAGSGAAIVALAPGMNGSGGDNRVYGVGRNTYRYPATWKVDLRLARHLNLGGMRQLEFLAESFNLFNHRNVTRIESVGYWIESGTTNGGPAKLNFMDGSTTSKTAFGEPLDVNSTNSYRERQLQFGIRYRF